MQLDAYAAWGFGGQWVVAILALDIVIAVNARGYDGNEAAINAAHALIRRYVLEAVTNQ